MSTRAPVCVGEQLRQSRPLEMRRSLMLLFVVCCLQHQLCSQPSTYTSLLWITSQLLLHIKFNTGNNCIIIVRIQIFPVFSSILHFGTCMFLTVLFSDKINVDLGRSFSKCAEVDLSKQETPHSAQTLAVRTRHHLRWVDSFISRWVDTEWNWSRIFTVLCRTIRAASPALADTVTAGLVIALWLFVNFVHQLLEFLCVRWWDEMKCEVRENSCCV